MASTPSKFDGQGVTFKAKLIGIEGVPASRGEEMTQKALITMKAAVLVAKEHKQKIVLRIVRSGVLLLDASSEQLLHDHAVTRISYVARDATDNRAFGYIYATADDKFIFVGIKTEKAAEQVVTALSELFHELQELRKKASATVASDASSAGGTSTLPSQTSVASPAASAAISANVSSQLSTATVTTAVGAANAVGAAQQPPSGVPPLLADLPPAAPMNVKTEPFDVQQPAAAAAAAATATATGVFGGQPAAPSSNLPELGAQLSDLSLNQPLHQMQYQGYAGGVQPPSAAGAAALPSAGHLAATSWPAAFPPPSVSTMPPMAGLQQMAPWPAPGYLVQQQPQQPQQQSMPPAAAFPQPLAAAYGQPYPVAPFQPVVAASSAAALGMMPPQPVSGTYGTTMQPAASHTGAGAWPPTDSLVNDPFLSLRSESANLNGVATASAIPLQPQPLPPRAIASAGGHVEQQTSRTFDVFDSIDVLGKSGQKPVRKEEFFSDVKNPTKKTLQEMAQQQVAKPAVAGEVSFGIGTSNVVVTSRDGGCCSSCIGEDRISCFNCERVDGYASYDGCEAGEQLIPDGCGSQSAGSAVARVPAEGDRVAADNQPKEEVCETRVTQEPCRAFLRPDDVRGSPAEAENFDLAPPAYPPPSLPALNPDATDSALNLARVSTGSERGVNVSVPQNVTVSACGPDAAPSAASVDCLPLPEQLVTAPVVKPTNDEYYFPAQSTESNACSFAALDHSIHFVEPVAFSISSEASGLSFDVAPYECIVSAATPLVLGKSCRPDQLSTGSRTIDDGRSPDDNVELSSFSSPTFPPPSLPPPAVPPSHPLPPPVPRRIRDQTESPYSNSSPAAPATCRQVPAVPYRKLPATCAADCVETAFAPPVEPPPSLPEHLRTQLLEVATVSPPPPPPRPRPFAECGRASDASQLKDAGDSRPS